MQNLSPASTRFSFTPSEPIRFRSYSQDQPQRDALICPHCGTLSQAAGKVKNSWYALCKCGTYIQHCASISEYYD